MKTAVVRAFGLFASMAVAGVASSRQPVDPASYGYFEFARPTDGIRVLGNTSLGGGDFTYEVQIWLEPEKPLGSVVYEWADGTEDKAIVVSGDGSYVTSGCYCSSIGNCSGTASGLVGGRWAHLAWVHQGSRLRLFVDGQAVSESSVFGCYGDDSNSTFGIGWLPRFPRSFCGKLDWLRISSVARYWDDFSPPKEDQIVTDGTTQLLLKFNDPIGSVTAHDESPNHWNCSLGQPSGATAPSIVKFSSDCNGDGIVDYGQIQSGQLDDDNGDGIPDVCQYTVTGVIPVSGASSGGTAITVKGTNFPESPAVLIGGVAATDVVRVSATRITATTPAGLPGMTSVTVGNWVQPNAFYYRPECGSDLDQDGEVTAADIAIVLLDFGPCYVSAAPNPPEDSRPFMLREEAAPVAPRSR
jgi:hypothetical protein